MEVKYVLLAAFVSAAFVSVVGVVQANHFSTCSPACNTTVVWWNDTVNVTGNGTGGTAVTVRIDDRQVCSTNTGASYWNCSFTAPQRVGDYNLSVAVGSTVDDRTLTIRPAYGEKPTGSLARFVIETPWAMQEPSGRVSLVRSRLTVSRGTTAG